AHQIQRVHQRWLTSHVFPGDTDHGQAFVHLDDLVAALWLVVERRTQLPAETVLLIGEPMTFSYDELQHALARLIHNEKDWDTQEIPKVVAKSRGWLQDHLRLMEEPFIKPWMIDMADDHYALDITRARTLLGWKPHHTVCETLPRMVTALKVDPEAWYREHKLEPPADTVAGGRHH